MWKMFTYRIKFSQFKLDVTEEAMFLCKPLNSVNCNRIMLVSHFFNTRVLLTSDHPKNWPSKHFIVKTHKIMLTLNIALG